jgi:hypothetical protein
MARRWGEITGRALRAGRPLPANDAWVAACCLSYGVPLATLNTRDFAAIAGLRCSRPDCAFGLPNRAPSTGHPPLPLWDDGERGSLWSAAGRVRIDAHDQAQPACQERDCGSTGSASMTWSSRSPTPLAGSWMNPATLGLAAGRAMAARPVEVQLLHPDMGIAEPLAAVVERYDLDREALEAAAQSALAAPNRVVSVEVAAASPA